MSAKTTDHEQRPRCECRHRYEDHTHHHMDDPSRPSCRKPSCANPRNPRRCSGYYPERLRKCKKE